jgi:hypothetical protein
MAWSTAADSAVFTAFMQQILGESQTTSPHQGPSGYTGLIHDTVKAALYGNGNTPLKTDTAAHAAYNGSGGPWASGELTSSTQWPAGGIALTSAALTVASNVVKFSAANTPSGGAVTLSNVYGCLVYDDTVVAGTGGVADMGVCYNYFGGAQSVTSGTFTIVWNASGIFTVTV